MGRDVRASRLADLGAATGSLGVAGARTRGDHVPASSAFALAGRSAPPGARLDCAAGQRAPLDSPDASDCSAVRRGRRMVVALSAMGTLLLLGVGLVMSLMLPVRAWRTGEPPAPPLALAPGRPLTTSPTRVWIDTDAACGHSPRTDPDDCLAILLLAQAQDVTIAGVSTVFGNAPLAVTDSTTRALVTALHAAGLQSPPVFRGSPAPRTPRDVAAPFGAPPAHDRLRLALQEAPLVIVALGPMTNVAAALRDRPELRARVRRVVAVMGRRPGHLFHPVEGGTARSFLGHGPVFRDFNVAKDADAVAEVLAMQLPTTFVPYEAARDVAIHDGVLRGMSARGGAAAWVAKRAGAWLEYWREEIGREGFYPFDVVAAAFVLRPTLLRCADVTAAVRKDSGILGWLGTRGLFVGPTAPPAATPYLRAPAQYCPDVAAGADEWLSAQFTARSAPVPR
jgi:purine nucleosidase